MTRQPIEDILSAEINRLLRQEVSSSLADFFKGVFDMRAESAPAANIGDALPVSIVIHNNAPVAVAASETQGPFNQRQLEITIDQMVANSLAQGKQTTGVLQALFGLAPSLSGR